MILLDTHIWIWWVNGSSHLSKKKLNLITKAAEKGIAISAISIWEVAKLVEKEKLQLSIPVRDWIYKAVLVTGVKVIPLTVDIIVNSTQLKGTFHNDPADQIIVATANTIEIPVMTNDKKILNYPYVKVIK